jgi:hypothetical protein
MVWISRLRFLGLVALLVSFVFGRASFGQATGPQHPLKEYRRLPAGKVTSARLGGPPPAAADSARSLPFVAGSAAVQIGSADGPAETIFGSIADVDFDEEGNVLILDGRLNEVKVFTSGGKHVQTFARPGNGPGELRAPRALTVAGKGRIVIADAGKLQLFERVGGTYKFVRTERVSVDPSTLCTMRDTIYLQGSRLSDSTVIHRYSPQLTPLGSFGVVYRSGDAMADFQIARGRIACAHAANAIGFATSGLLGEVRLFGPERRTRWVTDFVDYKPIIYRSYSDGSFEATVPEGGYHRIRALVPFDEHAMLLQVSVDTRASRSEKKLFAELFTYRVDMSSGAVTRLSNALPLIGAISPRFAAFITENPFPAVTLREWRSPAR